jgi:hypothetical protein
VDWYEASEVGDCCQPHFLISSTKSTEDESSVVMLQCFHLRDQHTLHMHQNAIPSLFY